MALLNTPIDFHFDEPKATQAAAYLLGQAGGSMSKLALIKLLYHSDREAVRRWSMPITGDKPYCMEHGPILSNSLRLLKGEAPDSHWCTFIQAKNTYDIAMISDPGVDKLSEGEIAVLNAIWEENKNKPPSQLRDESHDLPEWSDPAPDKRGPLRWENVYRATGHDDQEIADLATQMSQEHAIRRILGNE